VMILINCTISGNNTEYYAAAYSANAAYLFHTTVTDNVGSGVYAKTLNVQNSIVAGNEPYQVTYPNGSSIVTAGCLIEGELIPDSLEEITYKDIFGENTFDLVTGLHRVPDGGIAAGGATAITAADLSTTKLTPAQQETILSALEKDQAGASRLTAAGDRVTCGAVEAALFTEAEETVTTLISDINPSKPGETVTFTAKVEGLLSGTAAEGWVEFYNGTTLLGTAQLVSGEATFSISVLSTGTHQICAEYLGDENFKPSGSELSHTVVQNGQPPTHDYCIKAFADLGTAISPAGMITVQSGGKMTFCFSADAGYSVLAVLVDGVPLSSADIANGCYTFYDVKMNHTIEVKSAEGSAIILTVVVAEGKGSAEYSVNGGALRKYISPVVLPDNSSLVLTASEDAGYKFIEWRSGETVFSDSEITFDDITSSVYLEVYFEERDTTGSLIGDHLLWGIVGLLLLLTIGFLLWFIFWHRRYYDVYFMGEMAIAGEQKTRRKNEYRFSVEDRYTGAVYYHVGEEEQWKPLYPDEGGIYTILKREVIDNIYLETRN
ncbi:MAG: Ig-like domain-containing protein, partial [Candidatus Methanoplasma sp.]|nr:Ig-like domain-containing protein [Candidatus Methanoplasma sp.]